MARRGSVLERKVTDHLIKRYQVVKKGKVAVSLFLKRKIQSGSSKNLVVVDNCAKVRLSTLFKNNQSQLFNELRGKANAGPTQAPNGREQTRFWSGN